MTFLLERCIAAGLIPKEQAEGYQAVNVNDAVAWFIALCSRPDQRHRAERLLLDNPIRPPWSLTWIEFRWHVAGFSDASATGGLFIEAPDSHNRCRLILKLYHCPDPGEPAYWGDLVIPCCNSWGALDCYPAPANPALKKWDLLGLDRLFFAFPLALMHVKNAEFPDAPRARHERRRAKREGRELIRFKELLIEPMRRTLRRMREHELEHPGEEIPLHLCRGHFKTYTADRPLLGQHVGMYWWDEHERGTGPGRVFHNRARIKV